MGGFVTQFTLPLSPFLPYDLARVWQNGQSSAKGGGENAGGKEGISAAYGHGAQYVLEGDTQAREKKIRREFALLDSMLLNAAQLEITEDDEQKTCAEP